MFGRPPPSPLVFQIQPSPEKRSPFAERYFSRGGKERGRKRGEGEEEDEEEDGEEDDEGDVLIRAKLESCYEEARIMTGVEAGQ